MATAKRVNESTVQYTKFVPGHFELVTKVTPGEVVLTLSEDEASVLRRVVGSVHGPVTGPRGYADAIWRALCAEGIKPLGTCEVAMRLG